MKALVTRPISSERIQLGVLASAFICLAMIASGVGVQSAIYLIIVVVLQTYAGIAIWDWVSSERRVNPIESISMGAAIGFILATVFDQLFLHTTLHQFAWSFPTLITVGLTLQHGAKNQNIEYEYDNWPSSWNALAVFAFALLAYSPIEKYQFVGAFILLIFVELIRRYSVYEEISLKHLLWLPLSGLVTTTSVMFVIARRISTSSLFYRQLLIGTDDILMNEQRSSSVALWGISDHSAATGIPMKYHWLSLAWSGMTSRIADARPFAVTLHLAPLLAFIVIGLLVWSIANRISDNRWVVLSAAPLLILSNSLPIPFHFYYVNNVSNVFTHIWFFAFVLCFINSLVQPSLRSVLLLPVFSSAVILGKGPFGIVLAMGICLSFVYILFFIRRLKLLAAALITSLLFMVITYVLFIRSTDLVSAYIWDWTQFKDLFPHPLMHSNGSLIRYAIGALMIFSIFCTRFPGIWGTYRRSNRDLSSIVALFVGCMASGLLTFLVKGWTAEFYFINAALCSGSLLALLAVHFAHKDNIFGTSRNLLILAVSTGSIYITLRFLIEFGLPDDQRMYVLLGLPLVVGLLVFCGSLFLRSRKSPMSVLVGSLRVLPIVFVLCAGFAQIEYILKDVSTVVVEPDNWIPKNELPALNWIRSNTLHSDIIATNRFICPRSPRCDNGDPNAGGSYLISSLTQRRVLLEGPKMLLPEALRYSAYPNWIQSRADDEINFVNSPSEITAKALQQRNVKWVYVAKDQTDIKNWEPYAVSRFENEAVAILELIPVK